MNVSLNQNDRMESEKEMIPPQHEGGQSNTESKKEFSSEQEAINFFHQVKKKLVNVNQWHHYAGKLTADFTLTDDKGNPVNRTVEKHDHFRIDIPGPGSATGDGYDWVQVEEIAEEGNALTIRVRPATNPTNEKQDVAHFFSDDATSSFIVRRDGNTVIAGVYGRNEKPNTEAEKAKDKIRNAAVATGAITGFAKLQWKTLVDGLLG
jgi:hypothetical protein